MSITHRETGEVSSVINVTGWSEHNFDKLFDGLVRKIDFAKWMPVFEPPRDDDQTVAEWLA